MKVNFWGTRGSIPSPMTTSEFRINVKRLLRNAQKIDLGNDKILEAYLDRTILSGAMTFGGNTPCIEIIDGRDQLILDCGTGLRLLGREMIKRDFNSGNSINIIQTHTHWDHIMGFPFFSPAFVKDTKINIYGVHPNLRERFAQQMDLIHFPITMEDMGADIEFININTEDEYKIGPFTVKAKGLHHPGGSYAYRITSGSKSVVFATDGEYTNMSDEKTLEYEQFYRNADVLIFDAMYASLEQTIEKENYGHSTAVIGINIALNSNVKNLVLFHHDPDSSDYQILESFNNAVNYLKEKKKTFPDSSLILSISYDGMIIDL